MPDQSPASVTPPCSIFDLEPLEHGGEDARQGFGFQDHVAAGFFIDMMLDPTIKEVWCETHDDITLLFELDTVRGLQVEFVQVKADESHQLWSLAKLTHAESLKDGRVGKSILEKCLANDRCKEPCCFRIVTARPVNEDLEPLRLVRGCEARMKSLSKLAELTKKLDVKLDSVRSPNSHDVAFWVQETYWQVAHDAESEKHRNLRRLHQAIHSLGYVVAPDQLDEIYMRIVRKAWDAATARFRKAPNEKKIRRDDLIIWLRARLDQMLHPAQAPGKRLEVKMKSALLPDDAVMTALEHRSHYLREILSPKYLDVGHRSVVEAEVSASLLALRARLDAGELNDNGVQFHYRCLQQLEQLPLPNQSSTKIPKSFLFGCMYNITDRCLHRFMRAEA